MFNKLFDFFKPPEYPSIEQTQKARFLHISLFVLSVACIILGTQNMSGKSDLDIFLFILGGISFICVPANKRGFYIPVALFISALILALITYSLIAGMGMRDAGLVAYPIFIIFSSYLFSKRAVYYTTFLSLASVVLVYFLEKGKYFSLSGYSINSQLIAILVLLPVSGFLLWVVVDNWERMLKNLRDTYDLTLAGWGQALEYHDRETEGHSQRVVAMTIALARRLGMTGQELENIRRGALLHDIGKMALPDEILLKPDKLSEIEWKVVKMHPIFARNMLENIPFLKPALVVPYSHHERWDGTGYPEGLSGEDIPFAARIFAVVDVWDALISDRPYRKAWPEEQARNYIRDQSGKQFDPKVVEAFLKIVGDNKDQNSGSQV